MTQKKLKGIDVICPVYGPDSNEKTDLITFKFATFRQCPDLVTMAKAIQKGTRDLTEQSAICLLSEESMMDAKTVEDIKEKRRAFEVEAEKLDELQSNQYNLFHDFIERGLTAAGYTKGDAETYMESIDYTKIDLLLDRARFGAGRVDFS